MKEVSVIHFMTLEYYPPIINFLDNIDDGKEKYFKVYLEHCTYNYQKLFYKT